ncbi:hypothetical protein NHX12_031827 [Muraenolepis orangiensis]|uniref:3-beta hydroxysteroid dehydrogenase/isomerase domain-containing protein n=1 Tax=Muraenolepis orangiensis TaxID=630683 RepID=A0A9Q0IHN4_9TELE|nr:hypothetical protein NHX12_031827 [Muraenolepis orangiensis]
MANERNRVYLVTGGCGFLGRHLLRVLLEKEDTASEIRLFDRLVDSRLTDHSTDKVKVSVVQGDITDYSSVREAARGADVVIHSASIVDVWYKVPEAVVYSVNVTGTENVIRACVEIGIQYLVYTSSMEVVGPNVKGDHFISKAEAEKLILNANNTKMSGGKTLHTCALRPTGIYGEQQQLIKDFYITTVRSGGRTYNMPLEDTELGKVYAGNVAWMHLLAARGLMERPQTVGGEAYFCYDDSPNQSYKAFNMQFMSMFNFRLVNMPLVVLKLMAVFNDLVRWLLWPVYKYTPLLNRYTLALVSTSFSVSSDKAGRHFRYTPLYDWEECRARTQAWVNTFPAADAAAAQHSKKDS